MAKGLNLEYIAQRRKELNLRQSDMAERLGMGGAPDYNKYENGVYKWNAEDMPMVAKALECPIERLFFPA